MLIYTNTHTHTHTHTQVERELEELDDIASKRERWLLRNQVLFVPLYLLY
jgi:hypothetical protein